MYYLQGRIEGDGVCGVLPSPELTAMWVIQAHPLSSANEWHLSNLRLLILTFPSWVHCQHYKSLTARELLGVFELPRLEVPPYARDGVDGGKVHCVEALPLQKKGEKAQK